MNKRERTIERECRQWAKGRGWLFLKWVSPGFSGVPDRLLFLPNKRLVIVEAKRLTGVLSHRQKRVRHLLAQLGWDVKVIRSLVELQIAVML